MSAVETSTLTVLAQQLEGDIRSRGLQPGDRYRSAADAALMLGVSQATAHRAMNLLVRRDILVRHHGRGTFVGPAITPAKQFVVRTVFVLMEEEQRGVTSIRLEDIIDAVRGQNNRSSVQFGFVPAHRSVEYVRALIGPAQRAGVFSGAIPISCPREVYRFLSEAGGPVVVLGSLYPDQWNLPSVDLDYRQSGHLLTDYLIRLGHKRLMLLAAGGGRPGDSAFYDGISDAMTAAELPHNALAMRVFPHDFEAFRAQVSEVLQRPDRPTGIICASDRLVPSVVSVADQLNLALGKDLELVYQAQATANGDRPPFVHVQPRLSFRQIADLISQMLKTLGEGHELEEKRVVIPVQLQEPSERRSR